MSAFDTESIDRLLATTRAVRKRLDLSRPVPRDVVLDCLRLAIQAPTGGNSQRWRWIVVDDPATRAALAALYREVADPYLAGHEARIGDNAVLTSSRYLSAHLHEVPVFVVACQLDRLAERPSVGEMAGYYGSVVPAIWSFMLALRSRGLGTVFTTLHLEREREAAAILGIPDTVTQVALLPVAYTIGEEFKPAVRRPIEQITYWNGWKQERRD
jgi:nitroreductase